jgi:hypothetical protein
VDICGISRNAHPAKQFISPAAKNALGLNPLSRGG